MIISVKFIFTFSIFCVFVFSKPKVTYERQPFFAVERPKVDYINPPYVSFANMSSRRRNRADPVYYFNLHFKNVIPFDNNFTFSFYFYQWLTNQYKPSFVELHLKWCVLMNKDPIFGATMKRNLLATASHPKTVCPLPAGDYDMQNCVLGAAALKNFPFEKGRIIANISYDPTGDKVASGYVDFEIKYIKVNKTT